MNADLSERVAIATDDLPWVSHGSFEERLLELTGDRRTALLRLPPRTPLLLAATGYFDVLILDGSLHDQHARYPARTYVRDCAGSVLFSDGAIVLAKARFTGGPPPHRIDTTRSPFRPSYDGYIGVEFSDLVRDDTGSVVLMRLAPGASITAHQHERGEEFFVLAGSLADEAGRYTAGHWVRQPPDSVHSVTSDEGALTFIFAHHLR